MDLNDILKQSQLAEKSIAEIQNQNRIFEATIQQAVKGVPDDQKDMVEKFRILSMKAINLAKQGKADEAQEIIKNFNHGGKN